MPIARDGVSLSQKEGRMEKAKYSANQVAEWFLNHVRLLYAEEDEEFLTNLKLQKLLYYAQGSCLALNDRPLFNEEIVHWMHGPVVPSVYRDYSSYRGNPIDYDEEYRNAFDKETEGMLELVYDVFGQYSAWGLRNLTHQEAPWKNTKMNEVISIESIQSFFKDHYVDQSDTAKKQD